jgi:hypothetical protein
MKPRVAVICGTPLLSEAVEAAVGDVMTVQSFPAGSGDVAGLLGALRPDGIVVESAEEAEDARAFACAAGLPLVHVSLADPTATPEEIRNVMVEGIFRR